MVFVTRVKPFLFVIAYIFENMKLRNERGPHEPTIYFTMATYESRLP